MFIPWKFTSISTSENNNTSLLNLDFEYNYNGLRNLLNSWNLSKASLINRQRFICIQNIIFRNNRNTKFEEISSLWRSRNTDW